MILHCGFEKCLIGKKRCQGSEGQEKDTIVVEIHSIDGNETVGCSTVFVVISGATETKVLDALEL